MSEKEGILDRPALMWVVVEDNGPANYVLSVIEPQSFGGTIGTWVGRDGTSKETTMGIIHYRKDGSAHITPAMPG